MSNHKRITLSPEIIERVQKSTDMYTRTQEGLRYENPDLENEAPPYPPIPSDEGCIRFLKQDREGEQQELSASPTPDSLTYSLENREAKEAPAASAPFPPLGNVSEIINSVFQKREDQMAFVMLFNRVLEIPKEHGVEMYPTLHLNADGDLFCQEAFPTRERREKQTVPFGDFLSFPKEVRYNDYPEHLRATKALVRNKKGKKVIKVELKDLTDEEVDMSVGRPFWGFTEEQKIVVLWMLRSKSNVRKLSEVAHREDYKALKELYHRVQE